MTDGYLAWADDPSAAVALLREWATTHPDLLGAPSHVARVLARMALRLEDHDALQQAVALYRQSTAARTGRVFAAKSRWVEALGSGHPGEAEAAADSLEAAGYRTEALDALADAALLAARAGVTSPALERAQALATEIGIGPTLGPLPEARWLARAEEGRVVS